MRRLSLPLAAASLVLLAAACREYVVAPERHAAPGVAAHVEMVDLATNAVTFDIGPEGGVYRLGPATLHVPANAVCDPSSNSYGQQFWDAPCTVATRAIRVRAKLVEKKGRIWVDFQPSLRFAPAPSDASGRHVRISFVNPALVGAIGDLGRFAILWSPAIDEPGTSEGEITYVGLVAGIATRRIKHFTGYNVHSGATDTTKTTGPVQPIEE